MRTLFTIILLHVFWHCVFAEEASAAPQIFRTPEELRAYLSVLNNFYALMGRPRFGRRSRSNGKTLMSSTSEGECHGVQHPHTKPFCRQFDSRLLCCDVLRILILIGPMEPEKCFDHRKSTLSPDVKPFIPRQSSYQQQQYQVVCPSYYQNAIGSGYQDSYGVMCNWPGYWNKNVPKPVSAANSSLHLTNASYSRQKAQSGEVRLADPTNTRLLQPNQNKGKSFGTLGDCKPNELQSTSSAKQSECGAIDWKNSEAAALLNGNSVRSKKKRNSKKGNCDSQSCTQSLSSDSNIHSGILKGCNLVSTESSQEIKDDFCNEKLADVQNRQKTFAEVIRDCNDEQTEKKWESCQKSDFVISETLNEEHTKLDLVKVPRKKYPPVTFPNLKDRGISDGCLMLEGECKNAARASTDIGSHSEIKLSFGTRDGRQNVGIHSAHVAVVHTRNVCARTGDFGVMESSRPSKSDHIGSSKDIRLPEGRGSGDAKNYENKSLRGKVKVARQPSSSSMAFVGLSSERVGNTVVETKSSRKEGSTGTRYLSNVNLKMQNVSDQKGKTLNDTKEIGLKSKLCAAEMIHQDKENNTVQQWKKKTKKKTDGERKKEYKNKLKCLPSVQGKILTVTHDFYNLVQEKSVPVLGVVPNRTEDKPTSLKLDDFPALGESRRNMCLHKTTAVSNQTMDAVAPSDSDWSDVDDVQGHSENVPVSFEQFPALGVSVKQAEVRAITYSALLKKRTYCGVGSQNEAIINETCSSVPSNSDGCNPRSLQSNSRMKSKSRFNAGVAAASTEISKKPKANSLIQLDLVNMLAKKQKNTKEKTRYLSKDRRKIITAKLVVANILDSSAPSRRRGKEREKPTKKKPTALKKIILQEREEKKKIRNVELVLPNESEDVSISNKGLPNGGPNGPVADVANDPSPSAPSVVSTTQTIIHNRKFREYCSQLLNPEIDQVVTKLIQDLIRFHDRLYQKDPVKAKIRRRIVVGLREVTKHLKLKKLKCIVLAPNLERIKSDGGLDAAVNNIISLSQEQGVPFAFALGRRALGRVCLKKVPVSCVGIFNYDGSEVNFKHLCELVVSAQEAYSSVLGHAVAQVGGIADVKSDSDVSSVI